MVFAVSKDGKPCCFRNYQPANAISELDEAFRNASISDVAAATIAARGLFEEATLTSDGGRKATFLDKPYPLGMIDPTALAIKEVQKEAEHIDAVISIGPGPVAEADISHLLELAYPSSLLDFIPPRIRSLSRIFSSTRDHTPDMLPGKVATKARAQGMERCRNVRANMWLESRGGPSS